MDIPEFRGFPLNRKISSKMRGIVVDMKEVESSRRGSDEQDATSVPGP